MRLQTQRLVLREYCPDDFLAVVGYNGDMDVVRYVPWGPHNEDDVRNFLSAAEHCAAKFPREKYYLAVCLKEAENPFGTAVIYIDKEQPDTAMIGWVYRKDFWGRGYGTEAAAELIRFCFQDLGLRRLYAICDGENAASARIMEKCDMRFEGRTKKSRTIRGEARDALYYAILRDEWE